MWKHKIKYNFYIIIVALIFSFFLIFHFNDTTFDILVGYADAEANKIVSTIINKIVLEEVSTKVDFDKLYSVNKNSDGDIQTIDFDPLAVNTILSFVTDSVEENLNNMENGNLEFMGSVNIKYKPKIDDIKRGIVAVIPMGISFNNAYT